MCELIISGKESIERLKRAYSYYIQDMERSRDTIFEMPENFEGELEQINVELECCKDTVEAADRTLANRM